MSLTENGGNMYMPVAPAYGAGGYGNGMFGDGNFWIIVLFLFALMGNGFGGGFGGGVNSVVPMIQGADSQVQRGFDHQAVMGSISGIQSSINTLAQGQCAGFAGVNAGVNAGFSAAEVSANARQMATMQQNWNAQSAIDGRLDSLAMNQATGACEQRAAIADLKYAMATEAAATRQAGQANTQVLMDKLCQLELDGVKQNYENRIAGMQSQINALTDQVNRADRRVAMGEEIDGLYNRLNNCPVPSTPVYGRTPIFTCNQNPGCTCGQAQAQAQFLS